MTFLQDLHIVWYVVLMLTNRLSGIKVSKIRQDRSLSKFENFRCQNNGNLKNGRFSAIVEKGGPYRVIQTGY